MRTCTKFTVTKKVKIRKKVHLLSGINPSLFAFILAAASWQNASFAAEPQTTLAISIRTLSSPYQVMYKVGAEAYAKKVGLPLDVLTTEANSQKGLTDIKAEVARTGANVAFYIDPNDASDALPIAKTLEAAGVYFVTWWSKPADVKVWDYPHWIAHISFDGLAAGTYTATELFKTFKTPGKGKIIALQGRLGDTPNAERWEGLQQVLSKNPGIQLLQWESAQWDRTQAYNDTKAMLVAHPDIDGVWTANDDMAMGAIQALKEAGLVRQGSRHGLRWNPGDVRRDQRRPCCSHHSERRKIPGAAGAGYVARRERGKARREIPAAQVSPIRDSSR